MTGTQAPVIYGWDGRTLQQSVAAFSGYPIVVPAQTLSAAISRSTAGGIIGGPFAVDSYGFTRLHALLALPSPASTSGDTLDVFIDCSPDGGTTWTNIIHFAQILGNGGAKTFVARTPAAPAGSIVDATADLVAAATPLAFGGDRLRVCATLVNGSGSASFVPRLGLVLLP